MINYLNVLIYNIKKYISGYNKYLNPYKEYNMKRIEVDGIEYKIGDKVKILSGIDARRVGKIFKFYKAGDEVSVAVQFSDTDYGMYQVQIIEKV
jgi:ribosomal protein L21E